MCPHGTRPVPEEHRAAAVDLVGVAPAMKRATGPTAKGRAHPHRGRTRVARRPRPACTFATPGHRRVPGGDERDGRPVRRPRRAAQPRTRISEAGRRSPRRTGGRTGRQESGTSPPGNRPKRTDHRQRRHVHDRHPAASPREPRGPAPRPDDRADEDLRDRSRRRGSMTAARSPWAWSSCCSQVALRRAIAHPGRLGFPTSMVPMHTCSGNPVADSVLLPAAPARHPSQFSGTPSRGRFLKPRRRRRRCVVVAAPPRPAHRGTRHNPHVRTPTGRTPRSQSRSTRCEQAGSSGPPTAGGETVGRDGASLLHGCYRLD